MWSDPLAPVLASFPLLHPRQPICFTLNIAKALPPLVLRMCKLTLPNAPFLKTVLGAPCFLQDSEASEKLLPSQGSFPHSPPKTCLYYSLYLSLSVYCASISTYHCIYYKTICLPKLKYKPTQCCISSSKRYLVHIKWGINFWWMNEFFHECIY